MTAVRMAAAAVGVALVGACTAAGPAGSAGSAPVDPRGAEKSVEWIIMPKKIRNIATVCHMGNRIYAVEYDYGQSSTTIAVVPADPTCTIHPG